MISIDRELARIYVEDYYEMTVTEKELDLFIEYVELYALSEQMFEDYGEEVLHD